MKAAIYARYSTTNQDDSSIEDQERRARAFARARGLDVVDVYSDAAVSGTHLKRDGLQRLLADAKTKKFRAVIVDDLARLSRDQIDLGNLVRQLEGSSAVVYDVATGGRSDDEGADLKYMMTGFVDSHYVKSIRRNTHRGLEGRAIAGYHTGGRTFGYSSVAVDTGDPKNPRYRSTIDPTNAAVVRRVFELFAAGSSPREIAQALNRDQVPAPHDGGKGHKGVAGWGHTTIRAMLRNRRYIGEVTWNAHVWKKKGTERHIRKREARPASEHVVKSYPELAIIEPALWERVQMQLPRRSSTGEPRKPRVTKAFALSGLLRCGVCGGSFGVVSQVKKAGTVYRNLGCTAHKDHRCANERTISERKVMTTLVAHLRERLSRPDRVSAFTAAFRQHWEELDAAGNPTQELQDKAAKQRQTIANVMQALVAVPGSKALADKLAAEERMLADLEAQLSAVTVARPKVLPHPAAIARYVTELADTIEAGDVAKAGIVLRQALSPFRMIPESGGSYLLKGAIDVSVCDEVVAGA